MKKMPYPVLALLLLVAVVVACRPAPTPRTTPPEPPAPPVETAPPQPAPKPAPVEPAVPIGPAAPLLLKVGLATDLDAVTFPCCEEAVLAAVGEQRLEVVSSFKVEPAAAGAEQGYYAIQAAALRDEQQANELVRRLSRETGQAGEAHFDADMDLYRVRVGRYATREAAEIDRRRLEIGRAHV